MSSLHLLICSDLQFIITAGQTKSKAFRGWDVDKIGSGAGVSCAAPHAHLPSLLLTVCRAQGSSVRWRLRKVSHFRVKTQPAFVNMNTVNAEETFSFISLTVSYRRPSSGFNRLDWSSSWLVRGYTRGACRLNSSVSIFVQPNNQLQKDSRKRILLDVRHN